MPCLFPHVLTNNPEKHHSDWHSSEGAAEWNVLLCTGWAGLSLAWLICANDAAHLQPLLCQGLQRVPLFAPISSTAFEALDITYFVAFTSLFPAEGPGDMAEEILLLHIVLTKEFSIFTLLLCLSIVDYSCPLRNRFSRQELGLCSLSSPGNAAAAQGGKGVWVGLVAQPEANRSTPILIPQFSHLRRRIWGNAGKAKCSYEG